MISMVVASLLMAFATTMTCIANTYDGGRKCLYILDDIVFQEIGHTIWSDVIGLVIAKIIVIDSVWRYKCHYDTCCIYRTRCVRPYGGAFHTA